MTSVSLKYLANILARAAMLFVAPALALSSCITEYPDVQGGMCTDNAATMRIGLRLDSRSSDDSGFEVGVDYENFIDIGNDNYRIYFFGSDDNKFIDVFESVSHPSLSQENVNSNGVIVFNGYLFPEIGSRFKIVVLANWTSYPGIIEAEASAGNDEFALVKGMTTIEELTTHVGSQFTALNTPDEGGAWLGKDRLMPFYGVRSYDLGVTHPGLLDADGKPLPGKTVDLRDYAVPMLRAMAKVEVLFDNPYATFEDVEMSRVCRKGFTAPYLSGDSWKFDWTDYWSPAGGWGANYVKGVHVVGDGSDGPSLRFTKVSDRLVGQDGSVVLEKWVAYMPEYKNKGSQTPTSIRVKLPLSVVGGTSGEVSDDRQWKEFFFTPGGESGNDDNAFDIERNNIYRFNVGMDAVTVDIQPFEAYELRFEFGLQRDERGDLMVLPIPERDDNGNILTDENGNPRMTYPQYFYDFIEDDNPNHKIPKECDADGVEISEGDEVRLEDGDYYAIVVGEDQEMSNAVIWVKDRNGCRVLSNFESEGDLECNARLVQSFYGNNLSEIFHKDRYGYRRVYHFDNHNSIVIHPVTSSMLFCLIQNYGLPTQQIMYYEVESWNQESRSGWIINKDVDGNETGFQEIKSDGTLGASVNLDGMPVVTND